ncbi:unnamed protein product [Auanema sp. JU1783]|nr:unnamed protein product [Auanema sp. JU1783]
MDIILISSYLFYMIPCSYAETHIFPGGKYGVIGQLAIFCHVWSWISVTILNIFMAINRFIVFCCPHYDIFSYRNTGIITVLIIVISSILAAVAQYVLPCCTMIFNIHFIAHAYVTIPDISNYSNYLVESPLNVMSSCVAAICYTSIFFHLQRASRLTSDENGSKQSRDIRLAVQFFAISLFHFIEWTSFRLLPFFINMNAHVFNPLYLIVGLSITANATMNSLIYIIFNKEIKNQMRIMYCRNERQQTVTVTPLSK